MRKKISMVLLIALAFVCLFVVVLLSRNSGNNLSSSMSSDLLLRAEDLNYAKFPYQVSRKKLSSKCSDILILPGVSLPPSTHCSQILYDEKASKSVVLNGIWVLDTSDMAASAFKELRELFVADGGLTFKDDIFHLGDNTIAFDLTEHFVDQPVYVQNILWQDDNFLVRLVYLGETPIDYDILVHMAAPIELRIMVFLAK